MRTIVKNYFARIGYFVLGIYLISAILAILGLTGISGYESLFISAWALTLALSIFLFLYSALYQSFEWALASISMFIGLCIMLIDRLEGGGHLLPVMNGKMLCYSALLFILPGTVVFYFTNWKKDKMLTAARKKALIVIALTYPIASAIYLCGAPLWASFLTLFIGFGYLFYRFRVMLFWKHFKKRGVKSAYDDI